MEWWNNEAMGYTFTNPIFLKLFYLIPIFWLIAILGAKRLSLWRLVLSTFLRSVGIAIIILVLAGFSRVEKGLKDLHILYLADMSDSIDKDGKGWMGKYIREIDSRLDENTGRELIGFALNAKSMPLLTPELNRQGINNLQPITGEDRINTAADKLQIPAISSFYLQSPTPDHQFPTIEDLNPARTNIAGAIITAIGKFPPESAKRIVLLTDGMENVGDVQRAAIMAKNRGVKIFTAAPPKKIYEKIILLKKLATPDEIPIGRPAEIKVVIENKDISPLNGKLKLFLYADSSQIHQPTLLKQWPASLSPGLNVFRTEYRPMEKGNFRIEAVLETNEETGIKKDAADSMARRASSIVNIIKVIGRPKVLYVNGKEERRVFLPEALEENDIDVETMGPQEMPSNIQGMLQYDSVIFSNVSKSMLKPGQMELIEEYVRDFGGGFVMLGGENSFIQGGYADTPIERILPVKMEGGEYKMTEKKYRLSLILVIDKSASMGGKKMTFAKKAAVELVHQLKENDKIGIVAFDNDPYLIEDLRPVLAVQVDIINKLSRLYPGGGTNIFPALKMAYQKIVDSGSKTNHVILLSDGNTEYTYYNKEALISAFKNANISISTIAIGKWFVNTELLKDIAFRTNGAFYKIDEVAELPKLIVKDVENSVSQTDIHEEFFFPQKVLDSQILKDISQEQLPPLKGYSIVTAKPDAETPLITDIRTNVEPILANWRYGLGKTVAYMADAEARWSADWIKWIKYNKFWSQTLRWSMKDYPEADYSLRIKWIANKPYLHIESFLKDEMFINANPAVDEAAPGNIELKVHLYSAGSDTASHPAKRQGQTSLSMETDPQQKGSGSGDNGQKIALDAQDGAQPGAQTVQIANSGLQPQTANPQYKDLLLRQISPTSYISPLEGVAPGAYIANVILTNRGKILGNKTKGLIVPQTHLEGPTDSGRLDTDTKLLKNIAALTHAKYSPEIDEVIENHDIVSKLKDLSIYLIPLCLGLFIIDIALRKW